MQQPRNKSTGGGSVKLGNAGGELDWDSVGKAAFLCCPTFSWFGSCGLKVEAVVMQATLSYKSSRQRRSNNPRARLHDWRGDLVELYAFAETGTVVKHS